MLTRAGIWRVTVTSSGEANAAGTRDAKATSGRRGTSKPRTLSARSGAVPRSATNSSRASVSQMTCRGGAFAVRTQPTRDDERAARHPATIFGLCRPTATEKEASSDAKRGPSEAAVVW
ncbi:hypothetical protein DIPPA_04750 [Diplonema papillatum]|nr:hypothetical protein DIPPA_04750 [Diplonema papillatum]